MTPIRAREELDWLFGIAESDMGIHSNFSALILASKLGTQKTRIDDNGNMVSTVQEGIWNETLLIDRLDSRTRLSRRAAAARLNRVTRAFRQLDPQHKRVLEGWFYPRQRAPQIRQYFGNAVGILHLTPTGESISKLDDNWVLTAMHKSDPRVPQMRTEANHMFAEALHHYESTRRVPR